MLALKLSKREKFIFILAVLALFSYGIYFFGYRPFEERSQRLAREILLNERLLQKNLRLISKSKGFDAQYEKALVQFKQTDPDEKIMSLALSDVEAVASRLGILISSKKPANPRNIDFARKFSIDLTVGGTLTEMMHFVSVLQNAPYLFDVEDLSISLVSIRRSSLRCKMLISRILIP